MPNIKHFSKRRKNTHFLISAAIPTKKLSYAKYESFAVPRAGVEPARIAPLVFETSASTDSATWAHFPPKKHAKIQPFHQPAKFLCVFLIFSSFLYRYVQHFITLFSSIAAPFINIALKNTALKYPYSIHSTPCLCAVFPIGRPKVTHKSPKGRA